MTKFEAATLNPRNTGKILHLLPEALRQKRISKVFISETLTCGGHGGRSNREKCCFQVRWSIKVAAPTSVMIQTFGEHEEGFEPSTSNFHLAWLTKLFLTQLDTCQVRNYRVKRKIFTYFILGNMYHSGYLTVTCFCGTCDSQSAGIWFGYGGRICSC